MKKLRYLLFPITIIYGIIVLVRNIFYNKNIIKSYKFSYVFTICLGNLSTGGTGKSPHIEYLIKILKNKYKVATLSRGYKRKTKGYVQGGRDTSYKDIGDEPMQFLKKNRNIVVAVDENRKRGIEKIKQNNPLTNVILLDDAFQHRKVKPDLSILITEFENLFTKDYILPLGNLREPAFEKKRANIIIISKIPNIISKEEMQNVIKKINPKKEQKVFFSRYIYKPIKKLFRHKLDLKKLEEAKKILLVTGIAKPKNLLLYLKNNYEIDIKHLKFSDHHNFKKKDYEKIKSHYKDMLNENISKTIILTTEKDAIRFDEKEIKELPIYYIPINVEFIENNLCFDKYILKKLKTFKLAPLENKI